MPLQPEFMLKFKEFDADRQRVRNLDDLMAFEKKWLDSSQRPEKSRDQHAAESSRKKGPLRLAGRFRSYSYYTYDITPEARYELFATLLTLGTAIRFPHLKPFEAPKERWMQWCPYSEISTAEKGEETCPQCQRTLLYECGED